MRSLIGVLTLQTPPRRDSRVLEAVAESNRILDRNAELIKELAAVEQALRQKKWKKRLST